MDEDEAALLAELRAISAGSAASRFQEEDDNHNDDRNKTEEINSDEGTKSTEKREEETNAASPPVTQAASHSSSKTEPQSNQDEKPLPPWKKKPANPEMHQDVEDVVIADPPEAPPEALKRSDDEPVGFQNKSTFQGERGGAAEDEDLLAELKAISGKSGAADRFAGEEYHANAEGDEYNGELKQNPTAEKAPRKAGPPKPEDAPPLRKGETFPPSPSKNRNGMDILVSSQSEDHEIVSVLSEPSVFTGSGFQKSTTPSNFQGERGDNAKDSDLLAELQGVSAKTKSTGRFDGDDDNDETNDGSNEQFPEDGDVTAESPLSHAKPASVTTHEIGGFQKSSLPNTFQGERGGTAEDEELLAELRAISSKSSGTHRFANDDNAGEPREFESLPMKQESPQTKATVNGPESTKDAQLPPWKRKPQNVKPKQDVEVTVSAPPPPSKPVSEEPSQAMGGFQKTSLPNTFQGERGGTAEDEDLLAELRAISSKSSGGDRFANNDSGEEPAVQSAPLQEEATKPKPAQKGPESTKDAQLPPWKRKPQNVKPKQDVEVTVSAPPPPSKPVSEEPSQAMGGFQKSSLINTFQGDRGGAAEDEDLLAELRAVSSQSKGPDRFSEVDDDAADSSSSPIEEEASPKPKKEIPLPPWKQKAQNAKSAEANDFEVVVSAPPPPSQPASEGTTGPTPARGGFQKSALPNTFKGERGGTAEDEELLAELMAISSKASGANRFAGVDENTDNPVGDIPPAKEKAAPPRLAKKKDQTQNDVGLPPWKRKGQSTKVHQSAADIEDVVVSAPSVSSEAISENREAQGGGFQKSSLPNTFKGERGGAAEDEDLLAELRAVSSGADGARRFAEDEEESDSVGVGKQPTEEKEAQLPPWKRKGKQDPKQQQKSSWSVSVQPSEDSAPQLGGFQKSSLPNTFKGDRGGSAEDEALLAELRAISSGAGGANRFSDDGGVADAPVPFDPPKTKMPAQTKPPANSQPAPAAPQNRATLVVETSQAKLGDSASTLTRDDFPGALTDKSWKTRKEAYDFLQRELQEHVIGKEPTNTIDAGFFVEGLDSIVPEMLGDSNASALDSALQFAVTYADYCQGAAMAEQAGKMVAALVKGSALSSSRPTTVKLSSELVLKLVEVGKDGIASAHAVVDILLNQGLTSRKPKIVITAASLIHDTATGFGAACLPLASVTSSAPNLLAHSNVKVRDNGLKIIAEIARALGSTSHIQGILDGMKKAQVDQLEQMIKEQPQATAISIGFRNQSDTSGPSSPGDALAALEAGNAELEAKRFAARPAVDLIQEVAKSEYSTRISHNKWSEKVAALDKVLECGGEKPYKLAEPSPSIKYGPLISEMKKLLGHTHFAVAAKAMQVLSMLAEGAGEKLFPYLRPLLSTLLGLSKDKKLNKSVASCLDSFFGRILAIDHLLESDALPEALDERKEKNALARSSALDFLGRCVARGESAGPRGSLTVDKAQRVASLGVSKLEDSDAGVRKAALGVLQNLQSIDDEQIAEAVSVVIEGLKKNNARAYKTLSSTMKPLSSQAKSTPANAVPEPVNESEREDPSGSSANLQSRAAPAAKANSAPAPASTLQKGASTRKDDAQTFASSSSRPVTEEASNDIIPVEEAEKNVAALGIPNFEASIDEGGVLEGLKSTKWLARQNAIKEIAAFVEAEANGSPSDIEKTSGSLLVVVKEHTRGFKETNVNVIRAVMELFLAVCDYHKKACYPLMSWAMTDFVGLTVDKVSDKKLSGLAKGVMTDCCLVHAPSSVVLMVASKVEQVKSPVPHEECLYWFKSFCNDFGASALGKGTKDVVKWVLTETKSKNAKVKKAAFATIGTLHVQLGPVFKALLMSQCDDTTRGELEKTVDAHPFDPSCASGGWPKVSIAGKNRSGGKSEGEGEDNDAADFGIEVPRFDLFASLPADCTSNMGSKDGKTAWKQRKQSIDDVDATVNKCSALLDTSSIKQHVELLRALRDRLSDSQSNLKPLAARVIGSLFAVMDKGAQAKLGKLVYGPLINATMTDIKKPMRDASLEALRQAMYLPPIEGGGLNEDVLESFINALAGELSDAALKAVGLPTLLDFVLTFAEQLPNLDKVVVARGQSLGEKFAQATVNCLTSSKAETRSKAESLLTVCIENEVISLDRIKACTERMKPAQQRSVGPFMAKLARSLKAAASQGEKENVPKDVAAEPDPEAPKYPNQASTRSSTTRQSDRVPQGRSTTAVKEDTRASKTMNHGQKTQSESQMHPLIAVHGDLDKSRAALRSMTWPEYPEEPLGSDMFFQLKKCWSPILPTTSVSTFFPAGGIKNQDDGKPGCDLLVKAVLMERAGEGVAIEEQLELIFRWMVLVLCSKEHTVGLQSLLSLCHELFTYLQEIQYELSDSEALLILPFLLEKASLAKGRFKEVYEDLLVVIKAEDVTPRKRLGCVVAVAMLERAHHAKARVMACQDCAICVEQLGLSGIGKKGVLVAAKALSEETMSENRNAVLDLMELVLSRMNGDAQRLARICGSSLSGKARGLVEERWQKRKASATSSTLPSGSRQIDDSSRRRSRIPTPQKGSPADKAPRSSAIPNASSTAASHTYDGYTSSSAILYDELPALNLRHPSGDSPYKKREYTSTSSSSNVPNTKLQVNTDSLGFNFSVADMDDSLASNSHQTVPALPATVTHNDSSNATRTNESESSGAAASLRARLMAIRERSKHPEMAVSVASDKSYSSSGPHSTSPRRMTTSEATVTSDRPNADVGDSTSKSNEFVTGMKSIDDLMEKATPLDEADEYLEAAIETAKKMHAALSKQQNVIIGLNAQELANLRQSIVGNVDDVISHLTRLMQFSLDCEVPSRNAGISVSLLSVCLATLMALFRDHDLAVKVSTERLTLLIRATGSALLDQRFAVSSQNSLDEATSSQVVRAINKLAVQAATGGSRGPSLSALMLLQRELSFETNSFNARLSRVVSKLFARVLKAEVSDKNPWGSTDIEKLLLSLDNHFHACNEAEATPEAGDRDAIVACRNMAKTLLESLLETSGGVKTIRDRMAALEVETLDLSKVLAEYEYEGTTGDMKDHAQDESASSPSKNVAALVSALGSAQTDEAREASLANLRHYQLQHGDRDLSIYLEQVSPVFRKYILDQLSQEKQAPENLQDSSMSERLRLLRSRLHTNDGGQNAASADSTASSLPPKQQSGPAAPSSSTSLGSNEGNSSVSSSSLRERLAAAQQNRKAASMPADTTSGSRAAALRARLQAVKESAMNHQ